MIITVLFAIFTVALLAYAAVEGVKYIKIKDRLRSAEGNILNVTTLCGEAMEIYNSKWAIVSFDVDGRTVTSENRIQVPMNSAAGDRVTVYYDRLNPRKVVNVSLRRVLLLLLTAITLLILTITLGVYYGERL